MERHGFVVLKDAGAVRSAYLKLMRLLKAFFDGDSKWKEECKGGVYFNERGIPMVSGRIYLSPKIKRVIQQQQQQQHEY